MSVQPEARSVENFALEHQRAAAGKRLSIAECAAKLYGARAGGALHGWLFCVPAKVCAGGHMMSKSVFLCHVIHLRLVNAVLARRFPVWFSSSHGY
jgi:hypothetical protein